MRIHSVDRGVTDRAFATAGMVKQELLSMRNALSHQAQQTQQQTQLALSTASAAAQSSSLTLMSFDSVEKSILSSLPACSFA